MIPLRSMQSSRSSSMADTLYDVRYGVHDVYDVK